VPYLRCLDREECGWEGYERSELAIGSPCPRCEGETEVVTDYDEPPAALASERGSRERAQPAAPRARARQVLNAHGTTKPPVPVHAIARLEGFEVVERSNLGSLRGRLIDSTIEVAASDRWVVRRFTVAHELGHHFLGSSHGSGPHVETEANAFAGELLVPGALLHAALGETTSASELAARFQVSQTVLEIAAENHRVLRRLT
jgi:hypothetical protein